MLQRVRTARRLVLVTAVWLLATVGIAFVIARHESASSRTNANSSALPIQLSQRATASLAQQMIAPVISGDGIVVADGPVFDLQALIRPADLAYRLLNPPSSVKALIVGGPVGFDCAWLGIQQADGGGMSMRCRIPDNIKVVAGLSGTMVLSMSKPVEAMALPVTAVLGSSQQGQVVVVADGKTSVRQVGLGAADTFWIEITSGLEPGELVLASPVQSDLGGR
jgi:hypothetical protein